MIYAVLGLIIILGIVLTMGRAQDHDDDDDDTPGGRRRVRIPVHTNDRGPR